MRRGDIFVANLDPALGSVADKSRPVVIVSNNGANRAAEETGRGVIVVVPLTSNVSTVHLFQVFVPKSESGLRADSKAQIEQIRAINVGRLTERIGALPSHLVDQIDQALRRQLDL